MFLAKLFQSVATTALLKWLSGNQSNYSRNNGYGDMGPLKLNSEEIKSHAVKFASLAGLLLVSAQLFVLALVATAISAAHSFDTYQQIQGTAVLWTSLSLLLISAILTGVCAYKLNHTNLLPEKILAEDPVVEPAHQNPIMSKFILPIASGILEGFTRERSGKAYIYEANPEKAKDSPAA